MIEGLALLAGAFVFAFIVGVAAFWITMVVVGLLWPNGELGILAFANVGGFLGAIAGFVLALQHLFDVTVSR